MMRYNALACCAALMLVACGKPHERETTISLPVTNAPMEVRAPSSELAAPPPPFVPPPDIEIAGGPNALFSLQHDLTVTMPRDSVAPRFQAARDACVKDKALQCTLTSASLTVNTTVSADLQVALPHDKVALFEKQLLKRLPQDGNGKLEITSSSTSTENRTQSVADINRELAQAVAYRDSLEALAKRADLTVDEVIKIHSELVQAQGVVDSTEAAKRASDTNIVLERMSVNLQEVTPPPAAQSPFADFWRNAGDVLSQSTADMLLSVVNALPWLPIVFAGLLLVSRILRRRRVKPKA
jgi:hypothetical protein